MPDFHTNQFWSKLYFRNIFKKMFLSPPKNLPLGRWKITYDTQQLEKKVYYANQDHCGPCGQYILEKNIDSYMKKHVKKTC